MKDKDITMVKPPLLADVEVRPSLANKLVARDQRPTHRLLPSKWLTFGFPFTGEKVDTIEWTRKELMEAEAELEEEGQAGGESEERGDRHGRAQLFSQLGVPSVQSADWGTYRCADPSLQRTGPNSGKVHQGRTCGRDLGEPGY